MEFLFPNEEQSRPRNQTAFFNSRNPKIQLPYYSTVLCGKSMRKNEALKAQTILFLIFQFILRPQ